MWFALYRVARNHPRLGAARPWEWYLQRAANTTLRLGFARIGYMVRVRPNLNPNQFNPNPSQVDPNPNPNPTRVTLT